MTDPAAVFEAERPRLIAVGYRMLGIMAEAEDAVQDCWLRWQAADRAGIHTPGAWLTTAMTRICIDRLRAAKTLRETYTGPWLPEPVVTDDDPARRAELASGLTMALMVVMETMPATERAAFILREAFDYSYSEISEILGVTPVHARKLVSLGRTRTTDKVPKNSPDPSIAHDLARAFFTASRDGDLKPLETLLREDVVLHSDGGGVVLAALNPIYGRHNVIRFLLGLAAKSDVLPELRIARVADGPGFVLSQDGRVTAVIALTQSQDGLSRIDIVRNPQKLTRIG